MKRTICGVLIGLFTIHIALSWYSIGKILLKGEASTGTFTQAIVPPVQEKAQDESGNFKKEEKLRSAEPARTLISLTTATITAYSGIESCHYEGCPTASGKRAYIGGVACPTWIKLGTSVSIDGVLYTCEDRTATRFDGRYDIFMGFSEESHQKAISFGKKNLEVRVLK